MKTISARELKNETGKALKMVSLGERVVITKRGKPVAMLVQVNEALSAEINAEDAWKEIEGALEEEPAPFDDWQAAVRWSRGRP